MKVSVREQACQCETDSYMYGSVTLQAQTCHPPPQQLNNLRTNRPTKASTPLPSPWLGRHQEHISLSIHIGH
jgi:hypothetical protein